MAFKKILVVNVNWVGDVIFSSPLFKALKENYPEATISCLVPPRVRDVCESIAGIDEIIIYDEKGQHLSPFAKWKLIRELKSKGFDIAFLLHRSLTKALLVYLAGIPQRIGYDEKGRGRFLTQRVKKCKEICHRSDYYLQVIEDFGVSVTERRTSLNVDQHASKDVDVILSDLGLSPNDNIIIINPGGNWDLKRWSESNFEELIISLQQQTTHSIVLTGAKKDIPLLESIIKNLSKKPILLAGKTSLKELMALMRRAVLVISADSGPLHVASSVGTKTIAIFGPTRPEITGPRGLGETIVLQEDVGCNQNACYYLDCPDNICMQAVNVNHVLEAVRQYAI